jgi:hypothetical protein
MTEKILQACLNVKNAHTKTNEKKAAKRINEKRHLK